MGNLQSFLSLFLASISITNALVNISCSHNSLNDAGYCPGDIATFMCNTTNKLLEWTIRDQEVDFSLFDRAGTVECGGLTHCNVSGILVQHDPYFSSILTLTVDKNLNNTPVQCLDVIEKTSRQCLVKVQAPPHRPAYMDIVVLNSTSVSVEWAQSVKVSDAVHQQETEYKFTAQPVNSCNTCSGPVEFVTKNTSVVLFDLELLAEYTFSVQVLDCSGKLSSKSLSQSVKLLKHDVTATSSYCSFEFQVDIEWNAHDETQQQGIEISISLYTINTVHKIEKSYVFENNATVFRKELSPMVTNLSANTEYEWMVTFKYNGRYMQLASGLFNTSEECEDNNGYSVATVAGVSSIGIIILFLILVGAPAAIIVGLFWVCKINKKEEHAMNERVSKATSSENIKTYPCKEAVIQMDHVTL